MRLLSLIQARVLLPLALLIFLAVPTLGAAASDPSWLNGTWAPDVEALIAERYPTYTPEQRKQIGAKVREQVSAVVIDLKAKTLTVKRKTEDSIVDLTSVETPGADTVLLKTLDKKTGATGALTWKRLPGNKANMIKPNGATVLYKK